LGRLSTLQGGQVTLGEKLLDEGLSSCQVAKALDVHPATVCRALRKAI
jgi:IS30 family transposase